MNQLAIQHLQKADGRLAKLIERFGLIDYNAYDKDSFYFLVSEITGQMFSVKAKKAIFKRLLALCKGTISPSTISCLSVEQLREIGLSNAKARYIKNLANNIIENKIDFNLLVNLSDEEVIKKLKQIEGVGNWTAKMYLIFFLQRKDILPYEDGAFLQSYKWLYETEDIKPEEIKKICSSWKPYTSIGARYMYLALDEGLTKLPIKEFLSL